MRLVLGLGNPGPRYANTRHNIAWQVLDTLASRFGATGEETTGRYRVRTSRIGEHDVDLVQPLTFMNLSGEAVGQLLRYFKIGIPDLLVISDDVTLPIGRLRVREGGSEGGHNGLRSIQQHLGTADYGRLRVGVGRGDTRRDLADHVLARFEPAEAPGVEEAIARAADAAEMWVSEGVAKAMNTFNRAVDRTNAQP